MPIHLEKYFNRVGYKGSTTVSVETLKGIHAAQVFSIPFENLTVHESHNINNPNSFIQLDEDALFKKLVVNKRGGYCHENNELLALVLTQLGFQVDRLAARVLTAPNLPITHKLLLVTIGAQQWIADAGFGRYGLFEPIPLALNQETNQYSDRFRLIQENKKYVLQVTENNNWKNLYEFTTNTVNSVDFELMNYYVSHHPDSIFVKNRITVILRPEGRIILNNYNLKIIHHGQETSMTLQDDAYLETLKKYFGIELPKETQLKKLSLPTSKTHSWYNFFSHTAVGIGLASTVYIAKQIHQKLR